MEVKIKKLSPYATIPAKAHPSDAGFDLVAISKSFDPKTGVYSYGTGLAFEIPEGYVGLVFPRSSIFKTGMRLTNCVGVIDSHYRGEVSFKFKTDIRFPSLKDLAMLSDPDCSNIETVHNVGVSYDLGDRIGQIIIMPYPEIEFVECEELSETDRGCDGYGSTGN